MAVVLTSENQTEILCAYNGLHDAEISSISICPASDGTLQVKVALRAKNHRMRLIEKVALLFDRVSELKLAYDRKVDYPNVRDEVAVGFFDNLVYFDFGAASERRTSPSDYRAAENYFVCESLTIESNEEISPNISI
jgi:hypothetical protein